MAFNDCDEHLGSSLFLSIPDDGDKATVTFLAEPVPREEQFRGQTRWRFYFPVAADVGLRVWGVGSRVYVKIRDAWKKVRGKTYLVVREGAKGSTETKYAFKQAKRSKVMERVVKAATPKAIDAMLEQMSSYSSAPDTGDDIPF